MLDKFINNFLVITLIFVVCTLFFLMFMKAPILGALVAIAALLAFGLAASDVDLKDLTL
jgi:hypothetical protein